MTTKKKTPNKKEALKREPPQLNRKKLHFQGFYNSYPKGTDFHLLAWLLVCQSQCLDLGDQLVGDVDEAGELPDELDRFFSVFSQDSDVWQDTFVCHCDYLGDEITEVQEQLCEGLSPEEKKIMQQAWAALPN